MARRKRHCEREGGIEEMRLFEWRLSLRSCVRLESDEEMEPDS